MAQELAAASVVEQVVDEIEKSPAFAPPRAGAAQPVAGDCPELEIVKVVLELVFPTVVGEKVKPVALIELFAGVSATTLMLLDTNGADVPELQAMVREVEMVPETVGLATIFTVQDFSASIVTQVSVLLTVKLVSSVRLTVHPWAAVLPVFLMLTGVL